MIKTINWVNVKEKLPNHCKILITDGKDIIISNGAWIYQSVEGEFKVPARYGAGMTITHWSELPSLPSVPSNNVFICERKSLDMWYEDSPLDADKIDIFFSDLDCIYRGNIYKNGKIIGDYSAKETKLIEKCCRS